MLSRYWWGILRRATAVQGCLGQWRRRAGTWTPGWARLNSLWRQGLPGGAKVVPGTAATRGLALACFDNLAAICSFISPRGWDTYRVRSAESRSLGVWVECDESLRRTAMAAVGTAFPF